VVGGIGEPKGHHQELIMAIMDPKCSLCHVSWVHSNLVIPRYEINLGVHLRAVKLIQQIINYWNRVLIFDSLRIQLPIINAYPPTPSFFLTKRAGDGKEIVEGLMIDVFSISAITFLYSLRLIGLVVGKRGIL
jgi:hypothetical protein